ncbi:MAG: hypothetical protein IKL80_03330 [Clostridia bacterium]|nr:hypothetical protein [Clostridia bacterium]
MKMSFIGGIVAGALVGSAITMVLDPISDRQRKKLFKGTHSVFKTIGTVLDTLALK